MLSPRQLAPRSTLLALLAVVGLLAAACGGSAGGAEAGEQDERATPADQDDAAAEDTEATPAQEPVASGDDNLGDCAAEGSIEAPGFGPGPIVWESTSGLEEFWAAGHVSLDGAPATTIRFRPVDDAGEPAAVILELLIDAGPDPMARLGIHPTGLTSGDNPIRFEEDADDVERFVAEVLDDGSIRLEVVGVFDVPMSGGVLDFEALETRQLLPLGYAPTGPLEVTAVVECASPTLPRPESRQGILELGTAHPAEDADPR